MLAAETDQNDSKFRGQLARNIVIVSMGGIIAASLLAIWLANDLERGETTRLVFSSVLPLFGTWVGTVLAFYFARENLAAATESTVRLSGRTDPVTPVSTIMIPKAQIVSHDLAVNGDATKVALIDLQKKMDAAGKHRIPILKADGSAVYVVPQSAIAQLASQLSLNPREETFDKTVADLLGNAALKAVIEAITFVGESELVGAARAVMGTVPGCRDVFVTKSGKREEAVVGWLTDSDLAKIG